MEEGATTTTSDCKQADADVLAAVRFAQQKQWNLLLLFNEEQSLGNAGLLVVSLNREPAEPYIQQLFEIYS